MSGVAAYLATLSTEEASRALGRCCGARRWIESMLEHYPFHSDEALYTAADEIWRSLTPEDWREAFAAHPRIGERRLGGWARGEQAGASIAADDILTALQEGNETYEDRFGHVFLICATGKSADEMLAALRRRLGNKPERELGIAAAEQAKITRLRLAKLAAPDLQGA